MRLAPLLLTASAVSCVTPDVRVVAVEEVPAQQALFRGDDEWVGGDSAYSALLPDGRVLWLFGDSFVAPSAPGSRSGSRMIRNAVAVQSADGMQFSWRTDDEGAPSAFFPSPGEGEDPWLWPGDAAVLGDVLLIFLVEVGGTEGGGVFGFETKDTRAVLTTPSGEPLSWSFTDVDVPDNEWGIKVGFGAVTVTDEHVVCFAPREPGDHAIFAVRFEKARAAAGDLSDPHWLVDGEWRPQAEVSMPSELWGLGQTEFSVHFEESVQRWVAVSVDGFGGTNVIARFAERLEGPWSSPLTLFRPEESDRENILVYSAKAHPHLEGDVVITYNTNHTDFGTLVGDMSLYFPRVMNVELAR